MDNDSFIKSPPYPKDVYRQAQLIYKVPINKYYLYTKLTLLYIYLTNMSSRCRSYLKMGHIYKKSAVSLYAKSSFEHQHQLNGIGFLE